MSTPSADVWELAGFPGRLDIAAYLTADQLSAQYRMLVDVLLDAQEHSLTGVGRDELLVAVRDRIADATDAVTAERLTRPEAFDLDARMRALQDWEVVIRWQDKAKTEADFIRTRDRYQLTSEAADLHRWLRRKIDEDAGLNERGGVRAGHYRRTARRHDRRYRAAGSRPGAPSLGSGAHHVEGHGRGGVDLAVPHGVGAGRNPRRG